MFTFNSRIHAAKRRYNIWCQPIYELQCIDKEKKERDTASNCNDLKRTLPLSFLQFCCLIASSNWSIKADDCSLTRFSAICIYVICLMVQLVCCRFADVVYSSHVNTRFNAIQLFLSQYTSFAIYIHTLCFSFKEITVSNINMHDLL